MRVLCGLVAGLLALGPTVANGAFVAYNDLLDWDATAGAPKPNDYAGNISRIGVSTDNTQNVVHTGTPGQLMDYASGTLTNVSLQVNNFNIFNQPNTSAPSTFSGGDALAEFGTIINSQDFLKEGNQRTASFDVWVDLVFTGMNPNMRYTVIVTGNRNNNGTRPGRFTISGADSFINSSSVGAEFSGPADPSVVFETGVNTTNGYVARFSDIAPGADGSVTVRVTPLLNGETWSGGTSDGRIFLNQLKVIEVVPEPATLGLLAAGGLMLIRRRRP